MTRNETPLTPEQSDFAAEHEDLIGRYLRIRHLPKDEYYDIAVFGYLRAVRNYLTVPMLQELKFSTIAYKAMHTELSNHFRALRAAKRTATVLEYDEERHTYKMEDSVAIQVERIYELQAMCRTLNRCLSLGQGRIINLKVSGYSDRETAKKENTRPKDIRAELKAARDNIVRIAPELSARAA